MWTRALLKENAKIAYKRNYWTCVIVSVILMLVGGGVEGTNINLNLNLDEESLGFGMSGAMGMDPTLTYNGRFVILMSLIGIIAIIAGIFAILFMLFITNVVIIGGKRYFMENREHKTSVGQIFHGFQSGNYMNCVKTMFFRELYIFGWTLLFIIPGIIKGYSYQLVPYILAENPNLSKDRAIELSCEMMDGHKLESFVLGLSFIGWDMLNAITIGILGIFHLNPYKHATYAEFYSAIKAEAFSRGITNSNELPGVSLQGPAQEVHQEFTQEECQAGYEEDIFAED